MLVPLSTPLSSTSQYGSLQHTNLVLERAALAQGSGAGSTRGLKQDPNTPACRPSFMNAPACPPSSMRVRNSRCQFFICSYTSARTVAKANQQERGVVVEFSAAPVALYHTEIPSIVCINARKRRTVLRRRVGRHGERPYFRHLKLDIEQVESVSAEHYDCPRQFWRTHNRPASGKDQA